jgi:signal transduction histidine kinase/CheY-like chemotaxis protein
LIQPARPAEPWSGRPDLLELLPLGIVVLSPEHDLLQVNTAARNLLAQLQGPAPLLRLDRLGAMPVERLLVPREDRRPHEVTTERPGGIILEVHCQEVAWEDGQSASLIILRDVTELRGLEGMASANSRLAAVGQLAAGIAHDFNNLLTGILGFAEILRLNPAFTDQPREDLDTIIGQARRAATLIRQILDFSRQSVARRQGLDLAPFLKECAKLLERTLPETITLSLDVAPSECLVTADPTQLQQMITNLAINARDAMPGGGSLGIRLRSVLIEPGSPRAFRAMTCGRYVELCVSDTGTGMSEEVRSHCFEPFFTTKEVGSGTGLGLAQVFGIVKQHSGFVVVRSAPGEGTEFTIWLPERASPATSTSLRAKAPVLTSGAGETVLVVEDDPSVRRILKRAAERLGYATLEATNGAEAMGYLQRSPDQVQLVISDVTMPVVGGLELLSRARVLRPDLPFIFISGYAVAEVAERLQQAPRVKLMSKPLSLPALSEAMQSALHGAARQRGQ